MSTLQESLQNAIGVFEQQVSGAFALNDLLQITWRHGEDTYPLAQLVKTDEFYSPRIELLCSLDSAQQEKVLQRVAAWWNEYTQKNLGPVLALQNAELKEAPKALAQKIYEQGGLVLRDTVKDLITKLEKEDRQALNKLGLRLGAFYIYQRDLLKPAPMKLKAALWRLAHDAATTPYTLPQDGNVSMSAPTDAPAAFYLAIGLPIFGKTCVRVDMIERLNSAIFDGAVEGKYTFGPALASTIGVSVETIQAILLDLGFPYEEVTTGEGEEAKTTRLYSLKRIRPKKETAPRPKKEFKKTVEKRRKAQIPDKKPLMAQKTVSHGYNAFAGLAALRDGKRD